MSTLISIYHNEKVRLKIESYGCACFTECRCVDKGIDQVADYLEAVVKSKYPDRLDELYTLDFKFSYIMKAIRFLNEDAAGFNVVGKIPDDLNITNPTSEEQKIMQIAMMEVMNNLHNEIDYKRLMFKLKNQ